MGRILKVRSGRPVPTRDLGATFRMTKIAEAIAEAEAIVIAKGESSEACEEVIGDLCWRGWDSYFDNTKWELYGLGAWDGEKWSSLNTGYISINTIGTWAENYRPSRCRVTVITSSLTVVNLYCEVDWYQGGNYLYASGVCGFGINVNKYDCAIFRIELVGPVSPSFYITNIEFFPGEFNLEPDMIEYIKSVY